MKKWIKRIGIGLASILAIIIVVFMVWAQFDYGPTAEAKTYLGEKVGQGYQFGDPKSETGFIFYQGAKVDPAAYSYIGQQLAEKGHFVMIPKLPFNIALLNANEGLSIIDDHPDVKRWYLIGHSLGGSAASTILDDSPKIKGIIFLASYPIDTIDTPSLTVYGGRDGVLPVKDIEASKEDVRSDATFHLIKDGNHANFGMYGKQKGDNSSPLSAKEQQDETLTVIEAFLKAQ
ncbi:alpha/beta hydrolase [Exiguobacterium sp. KRL4]|uniref:alpha/beta hydrolase n=1 Tax=Exiguobacterium sp. KRL4 TaxID=1914536 RepID=UPI0008F85CC6|nr:alpha/beta hydrolase [Exiguobacterium sp. KRL4]OIN67567.1 alpha/beta hydrolase [Exiguobacterium sp. KRL4]